MVDITRAISVAPNADIPMGELYGGIWSPDVMLLSDSGMSLPGLCTLFTLVTGISLDSLDPSLTLAHLSAALVVIVPADTTSSGLLDATHL